MKELLQSLSEKIKVGQIDWFDAYVSVIRKKHKEGHYGIISCNAAQEFPDGWIKAIEKGTWEEPGPYGDNFREFLNLIKE